MRHAQQHFGLCGVYDTYTCTQSHTHTYSQSKAQECSLQPIYCGDNWCQKSARSLHSPDRDGRSDQSVDAQLHNGDGVTLSDSLGSRFSSRTGTISHPFHPWRSRLGLLRTSDVESNPHASVFKPSASVSMLLQCHTADTIRIRLWTQKHLVSHNMHLEDTSVCMSTTSLWMH